MAASIIGNVTLDQMLKHPFCIGVRSRIKAQGAYIQNLLGCNYDGPSTEPEVPPGQEQFFCDYFDNTRTLAEGRSRLAGPNRPVPQKAGIFIGTLWRSYEALLFEYNKIAGYRPFGGQFGKQSPVLSQSGQDYVVRQMRFAMQRFQNTAEFIASRVLRGGFDMKILQGGNRIVPVDTGSGQVAVNFQVPANHKAQLALLAGPANIIDVSWATVATVDIIKHYHTLKQVSERESGYIPTNALMTSTMLINMINNAGLRAAGGSAFRVWESMVQSPMQTMDGLRERGDTVLFRALPQLTCHVYNGVQNVDQDRDSQAIADSTNLIPDTVVVFLPDASPDWIGNATGQEIYIENEGGQPKVATGFQTWKRRVIAPVAAEELHLLHNWLPVLYIPKAIYYATTVF